MSLILLLKLACLSLIAVQAAYFAWLRRPDVLCRMIKYGALGAAIALAMNFACTGDCSPTFSKQLAAGGAKSEQQTGGRGGW